LVRIRATGDKKAEFTRNICPIWIREKAKDSTLTLEDLPAIGKGATVQPIARGSDSFSGVQRAFISRRYTKQDIVPRPFKVGSAHPFPLSRVSSWGESPAAPGHQISRHENLSDGRSGQSLPPPKHAAQ
jgi:hypothetical protein